MRELRRLRSAVVAEQAHLIQAEIKLDELEGDRHLLLQDREAAMEAAESEYIEAQDNATEQLDEADRLLELQKRQAAREVAEAQLAQAKEDLAEELDGPDQLLHQQLTAALQEAQAQLEQAEADLAEEEMGPEQAELALREKEANKRRQEFTELVDGPDLFEVALRESQVVSARARVDDASEDLAGVAILAPFSGTISMVLGKIDHLVNDESRILELVDTTRVVVDGVVDAIDIEHIEVGGRALISLPSLKAEPFEGMVMERATEPRTERGVDTYPVRVAVRLPKGFKIPFGLRAVTTVVITEG